MEVWITMHEGSKAKREGFTIVELLIVIVVIGILAAIVIVAYNGIQTRANNTAKINELKAIHKLYEAYRALRGTYPMHDLATSSTSATPVGYCLGTGYPSAGSPLLPSCYSMSASTNLTYTYRENDTTAVGIRNELATIGKVPGPVLDFRVNNVLGPVAFYYTDRIYLLAVIKGDTIDDCPPGTERHYPNSQADLVSQNHRLECRVHLKK